MDRFWSSATPLSGGSPAGRESENLTRPLPVAQAIRWTPTVDDSSVDPPYPIFITQSAFAAVQAHAEAKPLDTASLGFLAGNLFRCPETDAPYVVIESAIQLPWSISGDRLRPALSQGWSVVQEELRRNGGRLLGWYHAHRAVEARLSPAEVATHVALFDQPWQVALVVTPGDAPAGGFFRIPADGSRSLAYLPFYELLEASSILPDGRKVSDLAWVNYRTEEAIFTSDRVSNPRLEIPPRLLFPEDVDDSVAPGSPPPMRRTSLERSVRFAGYGVLGLVAAAVLFNVYRARASGPGETVASEREAAASPRDLVDRTADTVALAVGAFELRALGADADVMSSIGGCTAGQPSRAGVRLASTSTSTAPPTAAASAPAEPRLTVTLLSGRTAVPAASEALIRVSVRRGNAPQRAVTLALRGSSSITGGTGSDAQALTDDSGLAVFRVPAGRQVATYHFEVVLATGAALPGRPTADLVVRPGRPAVADVRPARLELGGVPEGPFAVQATVRDSFGNPVPNEPLELRPEHADMGVAADTRATDSLGRAAFLIQAAAVRRPGRIELRSRGERLAVVEAVFGGPVSRAGTGFVSGGGQRGVARTLLPEALVFQAHSASGRPMPGRVVVFRSRNAQVTRDSAVTDSAGRARVDVTLGSQAGRAVVTASFDSVQTAETLHVDPGPAVELIVERDGARVDGGRIIVERDVPFSLTLKARDGYGNLIPTVSLSRTLQDVLRQYNARSQLLRLVGVESDSLTAAIKFRPVAAGMTSLTISAGLTATVAVEVVSPRR